MAKRITTRMDQYRTNVYQSMLEWLGRDLGVSPEALSQLNLGWVPIVPFKNSRNTQGWWAIPECDAAGTTIGIALRSLGGLKVMFPGSKHGLIYPLNSEHQKGQAAYQSGAHNWIRTADAQELCPVCGKPDGCLLSAENLSDPKAVICIRTQEKAVKALRFGYLHILKTTGSLENQAPLLPPSEHPVLIVEGMTDTAAAIDMGFVAVGRPSNLACMDMLSDLVRGRDVIVVGENDSINPQTGKRPGHEGMIAAFQVLRRVCRSARAVLPPPEFKDIRVWRTRTQLTCEQLLSHSKEHGQDYAEEIVLPDSKPLTIATAWLNSQHRVAGRYVLRYHKGRWLRYTGERYEDIDEETVLRGPLYDWCNNKLVTIQDKAGGSTLVPVVCTRHLVSDLIDSLLSPCPVLDDRMPTWINGASGPDPQELLTFANGHLHLPTWLSGGKLAECMLDLGPDLFSVYALPFPFDETATCPHWHKYLESTFQGDQDRVALLQEWLGYCMSPDTSLHKLMLFRGPRRSGKSTALAVLQAIVGDALCGSVSFNQLISRFGLESLVDTQVAIMGDARLPRGAESTRALEVLLNIVGEDPMQVDRKFKKPLANYRFRCRFTLASNELPELPDHAGALEARLNILDFPISFFGKEDTRLRDKLIREAPGIALWALAGLGRVQAARKFTLPQSSEESLLEWRMTTSPMASFLEECCDEDAESEILKRELFDAWSSWSRERGIRPLVRSRFMERFKCVAPHLESATYEQQSTKRSVYKGVTLKRWAARQFLGIAQ